MLQELWKKTGDAFRKFSSGAESDTSLGCALT